MDNWLGLARAVHYAAVTGLFGLALFRQYAPALPWSRPWALGLSLVALVSAIAWFFLVTVNLAGGLHFADLSAVGLQTSFGLVWIGRAGVLLILVGLCAMRSPPELVLTLLAAAALISIALTGHTQVHDDWRGPVHTLSDMVHLAGAGVWLGGLIGLARLLRRDGIHDSEVGRFSSVAQVAVAAIVVSGVVNALMLIGRYDQLLASQYVRQLLVKLAFVAGMMVLAVINRLALTPRLTGADGNRAVRTLRRNVLIEQALAVGVLLSVGWLGLSDPPG